MEDIRTMWHCGIRPLHNSNRQVKPKETHPNHPELRSCRLWARFSIPGITHDCMIRMISILLVRDCTETMTSTGSIWHACMHMMTNIPDFWFFSPFSTCLGRQKWKVDHTILLWSDMTRYQPWSSGHLLGSLALTSPYLPWSWAALAIWYIWLALMVKLAFSPLSSLRGCSFSRFDFCMTWQPRKNFCRFRLNFSVVHTTLHGLVTQILFSFQKGWCTPQPVDTSTTLTR